MRSQSLVPQVRRAAQERGIAKLIRDLGTNRNALLSYLTGTCRKGTGLLIESRFRELLQREEASSQQVQP